MINKAAKELQFRRRREALTDYRKRFALVKGKLERVVVRKTNKRILGQICAYSEKGDVVKGSVDSSELKRFGWPSRSNKATAYLAGMLLAKKAKGEGSDYVLDIGLSSPVKNSIPFAFAKGCIDAGMKLRSGIEMKNADYDSSVTAKYAEQLKKESPEKFAKQFGAYSKAKVEVASLPKLFNEVKEKIMKE